MPAPIGGWNARDSIAAMDIKDAVILDNMFPTTSDVMVREGYAQWATGLPGGQVESLLVYNGPVTQRLFGACGTEIYNVTSSGAVGAAESATLTNDRFQHVNISTSGGNYMYSVNGVDDPLLYDGTTWTSINGASVPAITGVTTASLIHVNLFKNRLWFTEKASLNVWYLPVNSIGGAASKLDFMSIARRGGYLIGMATWTVDAGAGIDDYAVFFTSEGEIIIYQGTDPSSATTWALKGVWQIGAPLGRRCFGKLGGDVLDITIDGLLPLSKALLSSRVNPRIALTDKIEGAMGTAAGLYSANFGWDVCLFPKGSQLILNVPVASGSQQQYVMNTITGSWCRFLDIPANCWALFQDIPYFGGDGYVGKYSGYKADNSNNIDAEAEQAFSHFGSPGRKKLWKLARPIFSSDGTPSVAAILNTDYATDPPTATLTFTPSTAASWDVSEWDESVWGGGLSIIKNWQKLGAAGIAGAIHIKIAQKDIETRWAGTDFVYEAGGTVGA